MNYKKIYDQLITRSLGRKKLRKGNLDYVYYEKHHITPKCVGGSDDKNNLVFLTAEEHWVAHLLLVKIYPENDKLIFACQAMSMYGGNNKRTTNKLFGWIRREYSEAISKSKKGKSLSDEHRANISDTLKGRSAPHQIGQNNVMHRPGVKEKALLSRKGKPSQQARCTKLYKFEHTVTGEIFEGTRQQFKNYAKIATQDVHALIHGYQQTSKKWKILKEHL